MVFRTEELRIEAAGRIGAVDRIEAADYTEVDRIRKTAVDRRGWGDIAEAGHMLLAVEERS